MAVSTASDRLAIEIWIRSKDDWTSLRAIRTAFPHGTFQQFRSDLYHLEKAGRIVARDDPDGGRTERGLPYRQFRISS